METLRHTWVLVRNERPRNPSFHGAPQPKHGAGEEDRNGLLLIVSSGLRPIPPPCLGGGSETSWMLVGISWLACRGPLGGSLEASWGPFWGLLGPHLGLLGASWGVLGGSWGPLGASVGPLEASLGQLRAEDSIFQFFSPSWPSLGPVLEPSWAVLGASWAVLGPSWAVLGPSWGPLGPSWSGLGALLGYLETSGRRKGEKAKNLQKPKGNQ